MKPSRCTASSCPRLYTLCPCSPRTLVLHARSHCAFQCACPRGAGGDSANIWPCPWAEASGVIKGLYAFPILFRDEANGEPLDQMVPSPVRRLHGVESAHCSLLTFIRFRCNRNISLSSAIYSSGLFTPLQTLINMFYPITSVYIIC